MLVEQVDCGPAVVVRPLSSRRRRVTTRRRHPDVVVVVRSLQMIGSAWVVVENHTARTLRLGGGSTTIPAHSPLHLRAVRRPVVVDGRVTIVTLSHLPAKR
jgi:hypothetical protein